MHNSVISEYIISLEPEGHYCYTVKNQIGDKTVQVYGVKVLLLFNQQNV